MKQNYSKGFLGGIIQIVHLNNTMMPGRWMKTCSITLLALLMLNFNLWAQERQITGKVTDATTKEGIPGVGIYVKGTTIGTITDAEGNYQLKASNGATLVFQSVGYLTQELF